MKIRPKQGKEEKLSFFLFFPFFSGFFLSRSHEASPLTSKRTHFTRAPDHLSFGFPCSFFVYQKLVVATKKKGAEKSTENLERQARVLALTAALGAVANVLLRRPVERPDDRGDDDEGPALGSGDAEDLAGALSAEAVVDLL